MLAAVLVVGVNGVGKKNSVQYFETLHVTRPDAEQNKILSFTAGIDNLYCFSAQFEVHQVFGLRKEKVFCTANSVQSCGTLFPVFPLGKLCSACRILRHIQFCTFGNCRKERIQL